MKLIGIFNGWTNAPELWRHLLWPPLRIQRNLALYKTADGEWAVYQEAPAVYSIQVLGVVLFVELNLGMSA